MNGHTRQVAAGLGTVLLALLSWLGTTVWGAIEANTEGRIRCEERYTLLRVQVDPLVAWAQSQTLTAEWRARRAEYATEEH